MSYYEAVQLLVPQLQTAVLLPTFMRISVPTVNEIIATIDTLHSGRRGLLYEVIKICVT
jgi:hypothetical protein